MGTSLIAPAESEFWRGESNCQLAHWLNGTNVGGSVREQRLNYSGRRLLRRGKEGSCSRLGGMISWHGRRLVGCRSAAAGWHPEGRSVGRNLTLQAVGQEGVGEVGRSAGRDGGGGGRGGRVGPGGEAGRPWRAGA